jgi:hypothetical protein
VIPAPGGSSSIFLGTIDKNGARALTIDLQIAPDAEAKSQVLAVTLSYEGTKNRADLEEKASVNVPILQKARVRINDPVVYDDPWVGSNVSVGIFALQPRQIAAVQLHGRRRWRRPEASKNPTLAATLPPAVR